MWIVEELKKFLGGIFTPPLTVQPNIEHLINRMELQREMNEDRLTKDSVLATAKQIYIAHAFLTDGKGACVSGSYLARMSLRLAEDWHEARKKYIGDDLYPYEKKDNE